MTITGIQAFLRPRRCPDPELNASSVVIHWVSWLLVPIALVILLAEAIAFRGEALRPVLYLSTLIAGLSVVLVLNYRGWFRLSGVLLPLLIWGIVTQAARSSGGIHSPMIWFYPSVVILAGFARGARWGLAMGLLCCLTTLSIAAGLIPIQPLALRPGRIWLLNLMSLLSASAFQYIASETLRRYLRRAGHELAERERAERALAESEATYRAIVNEIGDGVGNLDEKGNSVVANPALEGIFGVGPGKLRGRNIFEFLERDDSALVAEQMQRRRLGETGRYQVRIRRGDGTFRTIHVTAAPQVDAKGDFLGAVTIVRDVTDPRLLEGQIRLLAEALRSAGECIWIADPAGKLLYVNDALKRTFGYEERQLLGRSISVLAAAGEDSVAGGICPTRLYDGWRGEILCKTSDGRAFPSEVTTTRIRDEHGAGIAWVGVGRDTTLEKQAEATLRESERRFREHLEKVQLAAVMIDRNGMITFANDYFLNLTGWTRDDVVGSPALKLIASEDQVRAVAGMDALRERARLPRTLENMIMTRSGARRLIQWHNSPLFDSNGVLTGLSGLGVDITEHRALMEQRQQSERLESVGRLAAGVAHDFNNLLTVINGYSEMSLSHMHSSDPGRKVLVEIRKAGEQAAALTRQLLTFSRRQLIEPGPVALNQVILESERMFEQLLGGRIRLVTLLAPGLGHVLADKAQLQQVLMNLMTNAMHAMPQGGTIRIETSIAAHPEGDAGDWILLAVSDNGVGMDSETLSHVFEPFFTTRKDGKGTGLGLSIVYGIVKQSNGCLTVESEPGKGTTFRIWLPRVEEPNPVSGESASPVHPEGSETVLVVEDREDVRRLVVSILERRGYRVESAPSGESALELVRNLRQPIDLLLTDVVMPGMNGRELAARLTARDSRLKVILMSGYAADVITPENLEESGIAFLQKPLTADVLISRVRQSLDSRSAQG
ncbi:MAG TPA: PAS domain S-box protein [Bryobacteraceae bacterium]|nr:PAS domain S-box protein [Bryobacteraceae bacterium]